MEGRGGGRGKKKKNDIHDVNAQKKKGNNKNKAAETWEKQMGAARTQNKAANRSAIRGGLLAFSRAAMAAQEKHQRCRDTDRQHYVGREEEGREEREWYVEVKNTPINQERVQKIGRRNEKGEKKRLR
jgi:hypothetical protein